MVWREKTAEVTSRLQAGAGSVGEELNDVRHGKQGFSLLVIRGRGLAVVFIFLTSPAIVRLHFSVSAESPVNPVFMSLQERSQAGPVSGPSAACCKSLTPSMPQFSCLQNGMPLFGRMLESISLDECGHLAFC